MYFTDFDFEDEVLDALDAMRFETCTPIQEQTIQPLMDGRDLIGVAQTGTGKTAAYLLPVLNKLCRGSYPDDAINCGYGTHTRTCTADRPPVGRVHIFYAHLKRGCVWRK